MSRTFPQSAPINAQTPISEVCPRVFQVPSPLTTTEFTVPSIIFSSAAAFFIDAFASASLISAIKTFKGKDIPLVLECEGSGLNFVLGRKVLCISPTPRVWLAVPRRGSFLGFMFSSADSTWFCCS
ncbi:hypothetical protein TNCV_4748981 [Trichonephila clavipes]|nr:hypothetical protein TNCV_4748981 [Trichonephila clavipes]